MFILQALIAKAETQNTHKNQKSVDTTTPINET